MVNGCGVINAYLLLEKGEGQAFEDGPPKLPVSISNVNTGKNIIIERFI